MKEQCSADGTAHLCEALTHLGQISTPNRVKDEGFDSRISSHHPLLVL